MGFHRVHGGSRFAADVPYMVSGLVLLGLYDLCTDLS